MRLNCLSFYAEGHICRLFVFPLEQENKFMGYNGYIYDRPLQFINIYEYVLALNTIISKTIYFPPIYLNVSEQNIPAYEVHLQDTSCHILPIYPDRCTSYRK